jgi:hypothetical protein
MIAARFDGEAAQESVSDIVKEYEDKPWPIIEDDEE